MKAYLMFRERDFSTARTPRVAEQDLIQDLELDTLWDGMAGGDDFVRQVVQNVLLSSLTTPAEIRYRQHVLSDCLGQRRVVQELYELSVEAIIAERKIFRSIFGDHGEALLHRSVTVLETLVALLRRLRQLSETHRSDFGSEGFGRFFDALHVGLDGDYFAEIDAHLKELRFREGVLMSTRLGRGNRSFDYSLRRPRTQNRTGFFNRTPLKKPTFSLTIHDRDEAGFRELAELRNRGLNQVANAVAQSADHVLSFFVALRTELAFYIGAMNLHAELTGKSEPACFPEPCEPGTLRLTARALYDPCLSLRLGQRVASNDLDADGKNLIIITGANQGGKSTFLRSLGVAHLMMQCGMFVAAQSFTSTVTAEVYTHYRKEEDATMTSGKFDEELGRMSQIADVFGRGSLLMCNESFAATNEREGSDIATDVVRAMNDAGTRVVFVTHMFDLAHRFDEEHADTTLFLRAERSDQGKRTYRVKPGAPLTTSYGQDLYRQTFLNSDP